MAEPENIRAYYDDYASWYEAERSAGYYGLINELELGYAIGAIKNASVLEVGCGPGLILEKAARVASSAKGADLSPGMVAKAKEKGLDVVEASATNLPFPDDSFDVVYAFKSLPHVPDIKAALSEIHRVLKPDGVAFLEFYNSRSLKRVANAIAAKLRGDEAVFIRYLSIPETEELLGEQFRVVGMRGVRIFAPSRHFYTLPVLRQIFEWLERRFCDSPVMARFAGYVVFKLEPIAA